VYGEYTTADAAYRLVRGTRTIAGMVKPTLEGRWHGEARVAGGTFSFEEDTVAEVKSLVDARLARTLTSRKVSAWTRLGGSIWQRIGEGLLGPVPVAEVRPAEPSLASEAPYTLEMLADSPVTAACLSLWRSKGHADYRLREEGYEPEINEMGEGWHPAADEIEDMLHDMYPAAMREEESAALLWPIRNKPLPVTLDDGAEITLPPWASDTFAKIIYESPENLSPERTFQLEDRTFVMVAKGYNKVARAYTYIFLREDVPSIPWYVEGWIRSYRLDSIQRSAPPAPPTLPDPPQD
jgi:hypothetical protein